MIVSFDLPDDVFQSSEVKPTRPKKKAGPKTNGNSAVTKRKREELAEVRCVRPGV